MIDQLTSKEDFDKAFSLIQELRPYLSLESYHHHLKIMQKEGYQLFALSNQKHFLCLAGVSIKTNFYWSKHLFIYDLITSKNHRSQGHGKAMLEFLETYAQSHQCQNIALTSGLVREDAHRFYKNHNYKTKSYAFIKTL